MKKKINLKFSEPDKYDQKHCMTKFDEILLKTDYLNTNDRYEVEIDGKINKYTLDYRDTGTIGYASMNGEEAINGQMVNVSIDWSKEIKKRDYAIINFCGIINHNKQEMNVAFFVNWNFGT